MIQNFTAESLIIWHCTQKAKWHFTTFVTEFTVVKGGGVWQ
jgi:hypothetical protein